MDLLLLSEFFLFRWVFCFLLISCFSFDWLCCAVVYSKRIVRSQCSCPPGGNWTPQSLQEERSHTALTPVHGSPAIWDQPLFWGEGGIWEVEKMVRSQGFSSRIRADPGSPHYLPISWRCGCCSTSCTQRKTLSPAPKSCPSHPELVSAPFPTLIPKTLCMGANLLSDQDVKGQKASSRAPEAHAVVFPLEKWAQPSGCALSHRQDPGTAPCRRWCLVLAASEPKGSRPAASCRRVAGFPGSASPRLPSLFPVISPLLPAYRHLENQPAWLSQKYQLQIR